MKKTIFSFLIMAIMLGSCNNSRDVAPLEHDVVNITLSDKNEKKLKKYGKETPVQRKYVKGSLVFNGKEYKIKIRQNDKDVSNRFKVKIEGESDFLDKKKEFNLIKAQSRAFIDNLINTSAANLGLITAAGNWVVLNINDKVKGGYYWGERLEKEFLEKQFGITNYAIFSHRADGELYKTDAPSDSLKVRGERISEALTNAINTSDFASLERYVDADYLGKFLAYREIYAQLNRKNCDKLKMVYDFNRGKIYPVFNGANFTARTFVDKKSVVDALCNTMLLNKNIVKFKLKYLKQFTQEIAASSSTFTSLKETVSSFALLNSDIDQSVFDADLALLKEIKATESASTVATFESGSVTDVAKLNDLLAERKIDFKRADGNLIILKGSYQITSDLILKSDEPFVISAGTKFTLHKDVSLVLNGDVTIAGTETENVVVVNCVKGEPFGTFALIGIDNNSVANVNYLQLSGGNEDYIMDLLFTGQFAAYNYDVKFANCSISNSTSDDGANFKYCKVDISNSDFSNNSADQVDLDFCFGTVTNCTFSPSTIDPNGDGLDLSGGDLYVMGCTYDGFLDKGLSIGENTQVIVEGNTFTNNAAAAAVKDNSKLYEHNNSYSNNKKTFNLYIKKKIHTPPAVFSTTALDTAAIKIIDGDYHVISVDEFNAFKDSFYKRINARVFDNYLHRLSPLE